MKFSSIFTDHAVLAAHRPIRIFGEGVGNASVSIAGITMEVSSEDGRWCAEFPAMDYGGPYELKLESGAEVVTLFDIYIGEVFLFSGQSNMSFMLKESNTPISEYETLDNLRYFGPIHTEKECCWAKSEESSVGYWSAIAYIASRIIAKSKDIAVGAICCSQGASVIESWVPCGAFSQRGIIVAPECKFADHFNKSNREWNRDGFLYEKMLTKVIPYSLTGVVWYQGESDVSVEEGEVYFDELSALIEIWRHDFCDKELPFVIVQLADFFANNRPGWPIIQKAQAEVGEKTPFASTVICSDVCEKNEIHPESKYVLAERVAKALLKLVTKNEF